MKLSGAIIQGGLAAAGLVFAYATWQREPERTPGEVVVLDVGRNDVEKVRYEEGPKWVELERRREGGEPTVWLRLSANAATKAPARELRGNQAAEKLFETFAPFRAARSLGALDAKKQKELGIEGSKKQLEVTARGEKHKFILGVPPAGVSDPYLKNERDGRVYVLGRALQGELDSAQVRLVDRTLHGFKQGEFDQLTVVVGGKRRELVQRHADNPQTATLAPAKNPDKADSMAKNWHDKVWRLFAVDVLGKGEAPPQGAPTVALRIDYRLRKKPVGWIEIGRSSPPKPQSSTPTPPPAPEFYAKSEHSAGWVKLPTTTEDVLKEAEKVAAAD